MIKIHNTRHNARHNSNLIVELKEFNCTGYRCTIAHCTLGQTVEKPQELSGKGPEGNQTFPRSAAIK